MGLGLDLDLDLGLELLLIVTGPLNTNSGCSLLRFLRNNDGMFL